MATNNSFNNDIKTAVGDSLNLSGGTTAMTGMIDDNTFATATASTAASSESIKSYVDTAVAGAGAGDAVALSILLMGG